ncbi:MAG: nicotinamide mononucleotide transporter [Candidatus Doudnabacteria bacterium]
MDIYLVIEAVGSIIYLTQKILLSFGKRIGWLFGFVGAISFTIVTFHKESYSYSILEITSGIIFIFGWILWNRSSSIEKWLTLTMSSLAIIGILFVFLLNLGSPNWILESSEIILFAVGAIFLTLRKPLGWILYGLGHLVLIYYAFLLGTYFIMALQIVSLPFAIIGFRNFKKQSQSKMYEIQNNL